MKIQKTQELKSLQVRLSKSKAILIELNKDKKTLQEAYNQKSNLVAHLEQQIIKLKGSDIIVSEHAIIRFLERAMGIDIDMIKGKILSESLSNTIKSMGNGKYPTCEGLCLVVKDGTVVSVV
jgi:hypothetical protein